MTDTASTALLPDDTRRTEVRAFTPDVPQAALDDLRERLARTRWPDRETVEDTSQGPSLAKIQALVDHWRDGYDWWRGLRP